MSEKQQIDKKDLERIYKYLAYKTIQIIVQSRLGERINTYSKPFSGGQEWFNISILNLPDVNEQIKRNLLIDSSPHCWEKHKENERVSMSTCHASTFDSISTTLTDPTDVHSSSTAHYPREVCLEISLKTVDCEAMVLELWNLTLDLGPMFAQVPTPNTPTTPIHTSQSMGGVRVLYDRMGSTLKSLITLTRVLPAYRVSRHQCSPDSSFAICYRFIPVTSASPQTSHNLSPSHPLGDSLLSPPPLVALSDPLELSLGSARASIQVGCIQVPGIGCVTLTVDYRTDYTFSATRRPATPAQIPYLIPQTLVSGSPVRPKKMEKGIGKNDMLATERVERKEPTSDETNNARTANRPEKEDGIGNDYWDNGYGDTNLFGGVDDSIIQAMFEPKHYKVPAFASPELYLETYQANYSPDIIIDMAKLNVAPSPPKSPAFSDQSKEDVNLSAPISKSSTKIYVSDGVNNLRNINSNYDGIKNFENTLKPLNSTNLEDFILINHPLNLPFGSLEPSSEPLAFYHEIQRVPPVLRIFSHHLNQEFEPTLPRTLNSGPGKINDEMKTQATNTDSPQNGPKLELDQIIVGLNDHLTVLRGKMVQFDELAGQLIQDSTEISSDLSPFTMGTESSRKDYRTAAFQTS
ncbi:unnamed protein product [Gordionus sp. m RMFG-2023]|uniref:uncharacterized protein LOC135922419 n=1 Tax=Gordionus sp. m RMFG-2023 TaxID=3053472 RepID=UPI0030E4708E